MTQLILDFLFGERRVQEGVGHQAQANGRSRYGAFNENWEFVQIDIDVPEADKNRQSPRHIDDSGEQVGDSLKHSQQFLP